MPKAQSVDIYEALNTLTFFPGRTPHTSDEESADAFACLSDFQNGGVYVGHYQGNSEWERHSHGDELVMVVEGETTIFLLRDGQQTAHRLQANGLIVVPQGVWHRFETPEAVKILTITPQPTDHQVEMPSD